MRRIDSATARRLVLVTAGVAYVALMWREIITHDKWRDEGRAWLIAYESATPWDVVRNMRYDGKPPLWNLILWALIQISPSYAAIKIVPILAAPIVAWLVIRTSELGALERLGLLATFILTGGYMVLARDYVVMMVLLLVLVLRMRVDRLGWGIAVLLAVFATVNFFSFVITAAILGAHLMVEVGRPLLRGRAPAWRRIVPVALPAAMMAISLVGFIPSDDNTIAAARGSGDLPVRIALMRAITWTFVPFRWNMWGFEKGEEIAALVVVALILWVAWRHSTWLGWWATLGLALLLGNHVYGHAPEWRHRLAMTAFAFGVYLCARRGGSRGLAVVALGVGLVVPQIFAQRWGAGYEIYHERPFSNAGRTAAVVARECGEGCTVVGDWGGVVESVSAHLDGRRIFYVNRDEFGTYATYVPDRVEVTWDAARRAIERFPDAVLVTSILQDPVPADFGLVAEFTGSLAGLEDFAVYRRIDTTVSP
ncbi:MAG: hypothetical protein RL283_249 [Actinomycetota bacterium]|jgi:hypothetical protein